jgi:hypothetical protein
MTVATAVRWPPMAYAIVVNVADSAGDDCPILRPYSVEFDPVAGAIQDAARSAHLKPIDWKVEARGLNFSQEIVQKVRAARLVVAVCTPDGTHGTDAANPNVMFELGLATALGKPALILTTNANALPADIRGVSVLEYKHPDWQKLEADVQGELLKMLQPEYPKPDGIWVAQAKRRILLECEFWKNFGVVLSYYNNVRRHMDELTRDFAHDLAQRSDAIIVDSTEEDVDSAIVAFKDTWTKCQKLHQSSRRLVPPKGLDAAVRGLRELAERNGAGADFERVTNYVTMTRGWLKRFVESPTKVERSLEQLCGDPSVAEREAFSTEIHGFIDTLSHTTAYATGSVDRLVELVTEGFEETPPRRARAAA